MRSCLTALVLVTLVGSAAGSIVGCGPGRRTWQPNTNTNTTTTGSGTIAATGTVASGTPREQLEQLDSVLRPAGFVPLGPAVHGNLPTNGLLAYAIDAVPGACYALTVIGEDPSQNIDMIVLDPLGRDAAHHVRPDNHPWVSFCAGMAGRFIARVQMAAGAGGYFYAPYQSNGGQRIELAAFFGDEPASAAQVAEMDASVRQRLGQLDQQMSGRGYTRVGEPAGLVMTGTQPREFQLNLQQGTCYSFVALGGAGAQNADVSLMDGSGQLLTQDQDQAQNAAVSYCAPATGTYQLAVRMSAGEGSIFTVGYVQNSGAQTTQPVMSQTSTAGAGLQENFALVDADMRARGYESHGQQNTGQLQQGGEQSYPLSLEGGRCYAILAVGDTTVQDLDLRLMDPRGREVDRDVGDDRRPTVRVCPQQGGNYQMRVQVTAGSGSYVYAEYRWPRGTRGPFGMEGITWIRMSEVTALLSVEQYAPDPGFEPGEGRLRTQGATASHTVELTAGQCYAVVVVGGEGVNDLDVTLSQNGTQLASDFGSRNAFPSVRHCATSSGPHTFEITAADGTGEYHYQIFSQSND